MAITYTAGGILSLKVAMLRYTLTISITYLTGRILNNNKWFSAFSPQLSAYKKEFFYATK